MTIFGLHALDCLVIAAYLAGILWIGWRVARQTRDAGEFFLAGRKLGKFYQFFLNFGCSTNADQAVAVSRETYRVGIGGMWIQFLVLFLTPFYWFTTFLFRRVRLVTIGDDLDEICREVRFSSERCDHVITSGGVGPTHDDLTLAGIAQAFGCPVVRHPALVELLEEHFGERLNEAALKMAEVPEGASLLDDGRFPTVTFHNIFILPGVPELFRERLDLLASALRGVPQQVARVFLGAFEIDVAAQLSQVNGEHPEVKIGSYPRLDHPDHRVMVTLECRDALLVREATARLLELLPPKAVLRVEQVGDGAEDGEDGCRG